MVDQTNRVMTDPSHTNPFLLILRQQTVSKSKPPPSLEKKLRDSVRNTSPQTFPPQYVV